MRLISVICVFVFVCLTTTFITQNVIASEPGTFITWSTKCLKNLKEYSRGLPANHNHRIDSLGRADRILLESNFRLIGKPRPDVLIRQYNTDHPKTSSPEKPGFVQKLVLARDSELSIVGDIHGSIHSLLRFLWRLIIMGYLDTKLKIIKPDFYMIFTGDYTDRGRYGVEVLITLLMLANQNKKSVFLLRGNHESRDMNEGFGLGVELMAKYGDDSITGGAAVLNLIDEWYLHLAGALYVGRNGVFAQCCHGGIEPTFDAQNFLHSKDTIRDLGPDKWQGFLWSDFGFRGAPKKTLQSFEVRGAIVNRNSCVVVYDYFLKNPELKCFFRGHQHCDYGLKMLHLQGSVGNGDPVHWKEVVPREITINLSKNQPVYTFSTGAEGAAISYDCFGIVHIGPTWRDWTLTPCEFLLDPIRDGKYFILKKNVNDPTASQDPLDLSPDAWQYVSTSQPISLKSIPFKQARTKAGFGKKTSGRAVLTPLE